MSRYCFAHQVNQTQLADLLMQNAAMCKHLFLIDDDEDELDIFMEAISKLKVQCKCTYAQAAEQALDMLNYLKPDVIFIDINMPKINGFDCVRRIRDKPNHHDTHIVMYSCGMNDSCLTEAVACGANTCLRKTTSIADLVQAMEKLVNIDQGNTSVGVS